MISPTSWTLLGGGVLAPGSLTQLRHRPQLNSPRLISQSTSSVRGHFSPTSLLLEIPPLHCIWSGLYHTWNMITGAAQCTALSYLKLHSTSSKFRTESQDSSSLMTNRGRWQSSVWGGSHKRTGLSPGTKFFHTTDIHLNIFLRHRLIIHGNFKMLVRQHWEEEALHFQDFAQQITRVHLLPIGLVVPKVPF